MRDQISRGVALRDVGRRAYIVLEDVARDERLVDARVLVGPEVLQRVVGNALMLRSLCRALAKCLRTLFSYPGAARTFARRHVGVGDGRWQRHEGCGLIYSNVCSVSALWSERGWRGYSCMQM